MPIEHKPVILVDGELSQLPDGDYISGKEEDIPQLEQVDFVSDTLIYRGWTDPSNLTSDALWKIARITFTGADEDMRKDWADDGNYTQIWDDRASLTYT